jgi:ribosomal protein S18 acetylase RimI-like enzyme
VSATASDAWLAVDDRARTSPETARAVLEGLVDWAAERGARTAYLQTRGDNAPALTLYDRLGFVTHHTYRYLRAPA